MNVRIVLALAILLVALLCVVAHAHAIRMKIRSVELVDGKVLIKGRVYFPGAGPAVNTPVYAYPPGCESTVCPPECKPAAKNRTDSRGWFTLCIPAVNGTWIIAAVHDPAHVVCREVTIRIESALANTTESAATARNVTVISVVEQSQSLFPLFTEERFGPLAEYIA